MAQITNRLQVSTDRSVFAPPRLHSRDMRSLRAAAMFWIAYLLILIGADLVSSRAVANTRMLPAPYYLSQLLIALTVLGASLSPWIQVRLGRAFLPSIIGLAGAMPLLVTAITVPVTFPGPLVGVGGIILLRTLPILTLAVVLLAWQYRRRHLIFFCLWTATLFTLLHMRPPLNPIQGAALALAQGSGLLVLGFCVSAFMEKLRAQGSSLEQANLQLRHYASTLEQFAISRERNRVAHELHDTLAHTLSGLTVQLEATKACLEADHQAAQALIQSALDTARTGLQETRRALKALRVSPLDELGLRAALRGLAERAAAGANLQLDCQIADDLPILAPDVEHGVYRVAQEAIENVIRHAHARTLLVRLSCHKGALQLLLQDDGCGFAQQEAVAEDHFGLAGMAERATLIGGHLSLTSAPNRGTTVVLSCEL